MTILEGPPRWNAQAVVMRARSLPLDKTLLVVEGTSDRQSIVPFLADSVHVAAAGGRPGVLKAREKCQEEGISNCLFLVDCDGLTSADWLGHSNLIISSNRDLEADFHLELRSFERFGMQHLAKGADSVHEIRAVVTQLSDYVLRMASRLGIVLDAARAVKLPLRLVDSNGARRRIRFGDIPSSVSWAREKVLLSEEELAEEIGSVLGWTVEDRQRLAAFSVQARAKTCRSHGLSDCHACAARRFCNGHDLVEFTTLTMCGHLDAVIPIQEVSSNLRMAADSRRLRGWDVMRRIGAWESAAGRQLLSKETRLSAGLPVGE
jgi:hypothetical protein